ncbi:hypothetical protein BDV96DRAFT_617700 [Lophiotrema nucula]|uniref:Uncharacterized protein n=1 Tax=Lophiotrema nucula TaxID=690887 RepID=A0A6A5YF52_9PLEO|nr:hypothetical protein BDV96DRAFT_617700 [Lophiotrema nucula]
MASVAEPIAPLAVEFIRSSAYVAKLPASEDPFRHQSGANSHNHHSCHPWGTDPLSETIINNLAALSKIELDKGVEAALSLSLGRNVKQVVQNVLDLAGIQAGEQIFIRLGATSAKDSFALNVPTTKPTPLLPNREIILRRLLTSGRTVGRILALSENIWLDDPDIWWEKLGWRERYSEGFADAVVEVWEAVKGNLPFKTCTMDWKAQIIEFNGFGAHLNTDGDAEEPDWLALEKKLKGQYGNNDNAATRLPSGSKLKIL